MKWIGEGVLGVLLDYVLLFKKGKKFLGIIQLSFVGRIRRHWAHAYSGKSRAAQSGQGRFLGS